MISNIRQLKDRTAAKLYTRFPWLVRRWVRRSDFIHFTDSPWTLLQREVNNSRLALIATGGVHIKSQPSFNMLDPDGDPTFREIPSNTAIHDLTITHNYYDHTNADRGINIVFPIERVQELKTAGDIGDVNHRHFSFMGHIRGRHIDTLINDVVPNVARILKNDSVDIVILTPA